MNAMLEGEEEQFRLQAITREITQRSLYQMGTDISTTTFLLLFF